MGFVSFALKRLRSKTALNVLYTAGLALVIGLVIAMPLFSEGAGRSIIREELAARTKLLGRSPLAVRFYSMPSSRDPVGLPEANYLRDWLKDTLSRQLGLQVTEAYCQYESPALQLRLAENQTRYAADELLSIRVACVPGIESRIEVVEGAPFGSTPSAETLGVWVSREFADEFGAQVGDTF